VIASILDHSVTVIRVKGIRATIVSTAILSDSFSVSWAIINFLIFASISPYISYETAPVSTAFKIISEPYNWIIALRKAAWSLIGKDYFA